METLALRPPRHAVSPRAVRWWRVRAAIGWTVLLGAGATTWGLWDDRPGWVGALLGLLLAAAVAWTVAVPRWRYRVHRWETSDDAVYTASGWLTQEWRVAPFSRIQTVDTARGPLQRALGLSSVTITTASAAGALTVVGLDAAVAEELVEQLTAATRASTGDAT